MNTRDFIFGIVLVSPALLSYLLMNSLMAGSGSKWDNALEALKKSGAVAGIRVRAKNEKERQIMKCSLQTVARTRGMTVMVLNDESSSDFFAWLSDKPGRFAGAGKSTKKGV